jgi:hypothetical protein
MRSLPKAWLLSLVAVAAFGCSDDSNDPGEAGEPGNPAGPGELTQVQIAGTWNITRLEFREDAPGDREFDEIVDGEATGTIVIGTEGDYVITMTQGGEDDTQSGHFEVTEDGVVETSEGEDDTADWIFTLEGNTLTGESADAEFNFDQDDSAEEAADVSVTLQKAT